MKKYLALSLALVMVFSVALTGCKASASSSTTATTAAEKSTVTKTVKDPYKDDIKIGFVVDNIGDTVGSAWGQGITQELEVYSNIQLQIFDGKLSAETQVQIMSDLINQKYDGIILQAHDAAALAGSVKDAEAAGIPVVNLNLDASTPHTALIAMVDYEAGKIVAEQIAAGIGEKDGNVVIIQAPPGASRGINVEAGFNDTIKQFTNITVLDAQNGEWLTEKGNEVMRDFLTKYPQIDAVFAINDAMAEGASQAAEAAGRLSEMQIWGADGEKKALEYIEQGKMTGTIYTNCYDQGATAARILMYAIGAEFDPSTFTKTPVVKMAPIVVTKDSVGNISDSIRW